MIQTISNICALDYVRVADVVSITDNETDPVVIDAPWTSVPITSAANLSVIDKDTTSGRRYVTSFESSLRSLFSIKALVLIKVTLFDGTIYIIGDLDFPVLMESNHALSSKTITFAHEGAHFPYTLADTGSGSGSGSGGL
jgi:hypothetical protein